MLILLDQSSAMSHVTPGASGTKWSTISSALTAYLGDAASAAVDVGIDYFPLPSSPKTCVTSSDCGGGTCLAGACASSTGSSCSASDYATPEVAFTVPPDHAHAVASLAGRNLAGGSYLLPDITGGGSYAASWAAQHVDRKVILVIVAAAIPMSCDTSPSENNVVSVASAAQASAKAGIPTYAISVGADASLANSLDQIALLGGTKVSIPIDLAAADPGGAFQAALKKIQLEASCAVGTSP